MDVKPVAGECSTIEGVMGILGRAWAGAVIQAILDGNERFNDIARAIPGVTDGMLSARLRELCARGLVERLVEPGPPVVVTYRLTGPARTSRRCSTPSGRSAGRTPRCWRPDPGARASNHGAGLVVVRTAGRAWPDAAIRRRRAPRRAPPRRTRSARRGRRAASRTRGSRAYDRCLRLLHVRGELGARQRGCAVAGAHRVAHDEDPARGGVEDRDAAGGVARGSDHLEVEHGVAVLDRRQRPRDGDPGDVLGAGIPGRVGGTVQDVRGAARVVAVVVGQDHVRDRRPVEADPGQGRRDRVAAALHARVHDRRLAAVDEDVGGHEAEVDAGPGRGAGPGLRSRRWMPMRQRSRSPIHRARRRRSSRGSWTGRRCRWRPAHSPRCPGPRGRGSRDRGRRRTCGDRGFGTGSRRASSDASTTGTGSHTLRRTAPDAVEGIR